MSAYDDYVSRKQREHGDKFDPSDLHSQFQEHFHSGQRVKVSSPGGHERTGTVSATTGWKPAFLLMHRSNATGSSDLLGPEDQVTHVQQNGRYVHPRAGRLGM